MSLEGTPAAVLPRGARLGDYVVATEIASGGMGIVYLARREGDVDRDAYAIKVVHDDLARRFPELAELLRREANLAAHIHHPHAVGVLEIGEHEAQPFAVMPYVEGGTLADLVAEGVAGPGVVAAVMVDALRGLHAAHVAEDERGRPLRLVHRDVCPENVLVGVDGRARIADFGIAVAAAQTLDAERGSGRGKWAYMSPEQLEGGAVDRRSDVFSAGVTLFGALTGNELFRGDSVAQTMQNVMHLEVPRPSEVGARPPPALDSVCMRALARDPDSRFSTAEAMASALAEAASGAGVLASPEEVAAVVRDAMVQRLAERAEALASLEPAAPARSLPLPPPNPRESAAEILLPDEFAHLADLGEEDDDDPDGPATSVYNPDDHGELDDLEIVIEGAGSSSTMPDPPLHAIAGASASSRPTMDLDPDQVVAAGSSAYPAANAEAAGFAAGTPPGGSQAAPGPEELPSLALARPRRSFFGRVAGWWGRFLRALRPRAR